jgi:Beta-lactamase enzyme family
VFRRGVVAQALLACLIAAVGIGGGAAASGAARTGSKRCLVPGFDKTLFRLWQPDMKAALAYARTRTGDIEFAVRTAHRLYSYRGNHQEWSASVLKAMLMVAYLDRPSVAKRPLNGHDNSLLEPMITQSDNDAASAVNEIVGPNALYALAHRVGMTSFVDVPHPWGESRITADDQTKLFLHIEDFIARRHRNYAMHLLASITPSQRWGIGEVAPRGWHLYFKGGWGSGTGLMDHQVVLLTRGCARVSLAVLTMYDGSHDYGKATLRGIFQRLLHRFPQPRRKHRRR